MNKYVNYCIDFNKPNLESKPNILDLVKYIMMKPIEYVMAI